MSIHNMDRKVALVIMGIAIVYLVFSFQLPIFPYAAVDADVLPKGLGFVMLTLAIILFVQNRPETDEQKQRRTIKKVDLILLLSTVGALIVYVFLLEIIGFVLSTTLFLMLTMRMYGYQKWVTNVIASITFTLILYFAFNYLLKIFLPQGILPF